MDASLRLRHQVHKHANPIEHDATSTPDLVLLEIEVARRTQSFRTGRLGAHAQLTRDDPITHVGGALHLHLEIDMNVFIIYN